MTALQYGPVSIALKVVDSFSAYRYLIELQSWPRLLFKMTYSWPCRQSVTEFTTSPTAVAPPTTLSSLSVTETCRVKTTGLSVTHGVLAGDKLVTLLLCADTTFATSKNTSTVCLPKWLDQSTTYHGPFCFDNCTLVVVAQCLTNLENILSIRITYESFHS